MQALQVGVVTTPVDVGESEIQIPHRTAHGYVGQAQMTAGAKRVVTQTLAHGLQAVVHLAQLAVYPCLAALALAAPRPMRFQARGNRGV